MNFARKNRRLKVKAEVNMTPVIDVVLLLLIFFMCSSSFVVNSTIPMEVPQANEFGLTMESKNLTITLSYGEGGPDNEGVMSLATALGTREFTTWESLGESLKSHYEARPDDIVLVQADKRVTTQRLIMLLSTLRNIGFKRYGLAAESPATGG